MIRLVDSENFKNFVNFTVCDPFAVRILALYKAYGVSPLVQFWFQGDENATAIISKADGQVTLSVSDGVDVRELREFISVIGFNTLESTREVIINLGFSPDESGVILSTRTKAIHLPKRECETSLYDSIRVIEQCGMTTLTPQLYTDFSHRVRHGSADYISNGKSTALVVSLWGNYGILGGVATLKDYRNKGFASTLIGELLGRYENFTFYTLIEDNDLEKFYSAFGFERVDIWGVVNGTTVF